MIFFFMKSIRISKFRLLERERSINVLNWYITIHVYCHLTPVIFLELEVLGFFFALSREFHCWPQNMSEIMLAYSCWYTEYVVQGWCIGGKTNLVDSVLFLREITCVALFAQLPHSVLYVFHGRHSWEGMLCYQSCDTKKVHNISMNREGSCMTAQMYSLIKTFSVHAILRSRKSLIQMVRDLDPSSSWPSC